MHRKGYIGRLNKSSKPLASHDQQRTGRGAGINESLLGMKYHKSGNQRLVFNPVIQVLDEFILKRYQAILMAPPVS